MTTENDSPSESGNTPGGVPQSLQPLPYHEAIARYLATEEADMWEWFASASVRSENAASVRLDLLKSAYRMERGTQQELYAAADAAAARLGITAPITLYQLQQAVGMNISLAYVPGEVHVILTGPVLTTLNAVELRALLGHELAHFLFLERDEGRFHVTGEILAAMARDRNAEPVHAESERLFGLYTEVYCDRAGLYVSGDLAAAVSAGVKITTGLLEASAESYLRQADEVCQRAPGGSDGVSHPESYIRARALRLWHEQLPEAEREIARMIEGVPSLDMLDLLGQQRMEKLTKRVITALLSPRWLQTEPVIAHARLFFPEFAPAQSTESPADMAAEVAALDDSLQRYLCYVLLDFAVADRSLDDTSLSAAIEFSRQAGLGELFGHLAVKELGMKKKAYDHIAATAASLVARATASADAP